VSKKANNPYELFEFFLENYKVIPKEQLLRLMQGSSHAGALLQMDQVDLAIEYAERCVSAVIKQPTADVSPQNNQPLLFRRFQEGGSSCSVIKSDARKSGLMSKTATLAADRACSIFSLHLSPLSIFVSSQTTMLLFRMSGFNCLQLL
jgi:hypothetical protein